MIIGIEASLALNKKRAGPENYYFQIIKHLLELPSEHTFRLYVKGSPSIEKEVRKLFPVGSYEVVAINLPRLWTQLGLALECITHKPDILFIPAHTMPILRWPNLKVVVTIHDLGAEFLPEYHQFPHKYYLNFATEYAARHAKKLIAISQSTKDDLIKKLRVNPKRIEVVYEGFNKDLYHKKVTNDRLRDVMKRFDIEEENYFLFIGTVQPRKNLERAIKSFSKILPKLDPNFKFIIVGQKGWLSDSIYEMPEKLGVSNRVKFVGYVEDQDLPALYKGASAFIYPSLFEGFGLPVLEAQASDCPVLSSNSSSIPEVAGEGAILVDPMSIDSIADGMQKILKKDLADKLVMRGKENINRFSWEKCAEETLKVLEEVVKS